MRQLNRVLISLAAASLLADMAMVHADSKTPTTPPPPKPPIEIIVKLPGNPTGLRPRVPSRQLISCMYSDGSLYFEFAIPEGECQLTMTDLNTGEVVYADFDSEAPEPIYIGYYDSGEISISTEQSNTYTGSW